MQHLCCNIFVATFFLQHTTLENILLYEGAKYAIYVNGEFTNQIL